MRSIDGMLSQRVHVIDPTALVTHQDGGDYRLEIDGREPVGLGGHRGEASQAVGALVAQARHRRSTQAR